MKMLAFSVNKNASRAKEIDDNCDNLLRHSTTDNSRPWKFIPVRKLYENDTLPKTERKRNLFIYVHIKQLPFIIEQCLGTESSHFLCPVFQNGCNWLCLKFITLLGIFAASIGRERE